MNINDLDVLTNREEEFLKAFIAFFCLYLIQATL